MQQLGATDASFLYMETLETPMHVGGFYLYELPSGYQGSFFEDFKKHVADRIHRFPMLRHKLVPMPFQIDNPVWAYDDNFELDYHIRHMQLPAPGNMSQLEELVGRLHSNFLDRSRPLWEFYVIEGLADGRVAEYTKLHHAAIDGGAGMALMKVIYDTSPNPGPIEEAPPPAPDDKLHTSPAQLLRLAYENFWRQQIRNIQWIPDAMKALADLYLPNPQTLRLESPREMRLTSPRTRFNVTVSSQRAYAARSVPLKVTKGIAKATGAKLNEVVLAMCAGALRRYLEEKGELPDEALTAFVPVSLREEGDNSMGNQVFGMLCSLGTNIKDPLERLRVICESSQDAKRLTRSIKYAVPRDFTMFGMPWLMQGVADLLSHNHLADRMPPVANVTVSNVPGPNVPLYLAGMRLLTQYPVSIPTHNQALNITVQSYNGMMDFGLTACRKAVPDVAHIADLIVESMQELIHALEEAAAKATTKATTKPAAKSGEK